MPNQNTPTRMDEFDKWAEKETATFGSSEPVDEDDYGEDYNISFSELDFYEKLKEKVSELLTTSNAEAFERGKKVAVEYLKKTYDDCEPRTGCSIANLLEDALELPDSTSPNE